MYPLVHIILARNCILLYFLHLLRFYFVKATDSATRAHSVLTLKKVSPLPKKLEFEQCPALGHNSQHGNNPDYF